MKHHDHHEHHHSEHDHASYDGHDAHAGHSVKMFKDKFWVTLLLTIPVIVYSEMIQMWFSFTPPAFFGSEYVPFVFSTIIFFYGGLVFLKGAMNEMRARLPGMMTLISLAIVTAYTYSVATQFWIDGEGFFWELATLVTIMLLGHWLEMASIAKAENALSDIAKLLPDTAEKLIGDKPHRVKTSELRIGDHVLVRPGGNIPVDGIIADGHSSVNEAAITGESAPVVKTNGDHVVAGTGNQDGALTIEVTKVGNDTVLAGIMQLVREAQSSKSQVQVLADKAAFGLTIIALAAGVLTFIYWLIAKDAGFALERAVTVLIIACPHALGLAIPLVVSISTAMAAKNGLLVRKRLALESARKLGWILFDKTGTLTKGKHEVTNILPAKGQTETSVLSLTASLESSSEHIVGKGISKKATEENVPLQKVTKFTALPGLGVQASIDSVRYVAVSRRYLTEKNITVPKEIEKKIATEAAQGNTEVYLIKNDAVLGAILLADVVRETSAETVKELKEQEINVAMVTGDSQSVAKVVAKKLNIDTYFAEVKPEDKAKKVIQLQKDGSQVAFVGDGINDAPALTQANIGLAVGAGTDVAIKSADIILAKNDPKDVLRVVKLSKATYQKMIQNLVWGAGYNVVAIPLAAGVLSGMGIMLSPAIGAVLMSLSTIVVVLNAQLLRRSLS